ncbi:hypothetical protein EV426DRAFT_570970 [Tirmania nivea]|nr:hypothetical protein EV426DRAFT_570970 [Tirmania nivea]
MRELRPAPPAQHLKNSLHGPPTPEVISPRFNTQKSAINSFQRQQYTHNASKSHNFPSQHEYPISSKCEHIVQFYDSESYLYDSISSFLLTSFFSSQEAAVVVATTSHILALEHQLFHQHCLFPEVMKRRGQLLMCEAEGVLEIILANGLTQNSFESFINPIVGKLREKGYARILVYGELVNLLCEQGRYWDAVQLEKICNVFLQGPVGTENGVELLCGYKMDVFALDEGDLEDGTSGENPRRTGDYSTDVQSAAFREICRTHSDVRPTEKAAGELGNSGAGKRVENFTGSATTVDIPRTLVPEQPVPKEQGGMMIAVLQHQIRTLEKQVSREKESSKQDRELRKLFNKLPVGIYASYITAEKVNQAPRNAERSKLIPAPKEKGKKQNPHLHTEQASDKSPIMNHTFKKLLGLDDTAISSSKVTTVTSAHRKWIDTFVHLDDREKVVASIESIGLGVASKGDGLGEAGGVHHNKCTYRIIPQDGQVKWLLGETVSVGEIAESDNVDESIEGRERKYIHSMTDLTHMMGELGMLPEAKGNEGQVTSTSSINAGMDRRGWTESRSSTYEDLKNSEPVTAAHTGIHKRRATEDPKAQSSPLSHSNPHKHHQAKHLQHCVGLDILNLTIPPTEFFQERRLGHHTTVDSRFSEPSLHLSGVLKQASQAASVYQQYHSLAAHTQNQFSDAQNYPNSAPGAWASGRYLHTHDRRNSATSSQSTNTTKSYNSGRSSATNRRGDISDGMSSAIPTPPETARTQ